MFTSDKTNFLVSSPARLGAVGLILLGLFATAEAQTFTIKGNTPGFIKKATAWGAVDPSTVISVTAWLNFHNPRQAGPAAESERYR